MSVCFVIIDSVKLSLLFYTAIGVYILNIYLTKRPRITAKPPKTKLTMKTTRFTAVKVWIFPEIKYTCLSARVLLCDLAVEIPVQEG
jgi:hypothetical protein